jgi:glycosyltransferase involved in cell wall biosynthesis
MASPLVTVAIPSYNLEGYIGHAIKRVLKQTYENLEIIVVDDGSTDDSMTEINAYAAKDKRLVVQHNKRHLGVGHVRNQLVDLARGEYFIFVDGDDQVVPTFVEVLVHALEDHPEVSIASVGFSWGGSIAGAPKKQGGVVWHEIDRSAMFEGVTRRGHVISGMVWNKIYRLAEIKASGVRFDETLELAEDHLWIAQLVASPVLSDHYMYSPDVFYYKVNRPNSIIHTATRALREREHEIDEMIARIGDDIF